VRVVCWGARNAEALEISKCRGRHHMNSLVTRASNGQPTTGLHHQDHPRARRRGRTLSDLKLNSLPRHVNAIPKPLFGATLTRPNRAHILGRLR
jgi:hypothetical protein